MKRFWLALCALLVMVASAQRVSAYDHDGDGYPDAAELRGADRERFLAWFAAIAESQYTAPNPDWTARDCSGLVRYAYTEALKDKDSVWFNKFRAPLRVSYPPTTRYPMPLISRSVFRVAAGRYEARDVAEGKLVGEASAFELMRYSSVPLGKNEARARRGDLLFFAHPLAEGSGYHSMVYLGGGRVVYHTGLEPEAGGKVKLLTLETLRRHPDPSWHPDPDNPSFLGFYRWKIAS